MCLSRTELRNTVEGRQRWLTEHVIPHGMVPAQCSENNVYAIWKVEPENDAVPTISALDKKVLLEICVAETNSLKLLKDEGACGGCDGDACLPPHSLLLVLRGEISGGFDMSCAELMNAYTSDVQSQFTQKLVTCTNQMRDTWDPNAQVFDDLSSCPDYFMVNLIDANFGVNGNTKLRYTSSYFHTAMIGDADADDEMTKKIFEKFDDFDQADGINVLGAYDTVFESFNTIYVDELVTSDMTLAVASLTVTFIAMAIHTKSMWLTLMGIFQILYAIPLAYFVYTFIAQLNFFPFLNFLGVFVSAALGADDLFVAVDKWKNARLANPDGTVEDIAEIALPDAAGAMLLTTSTTAVAFFATCICPVPPILCFAVFLGLMIVFNYVMNVLLVFPALCLYDTWIQRGSTNCLVVFCSKKNKKENDGEEDVEESSNEKKSELSLIHRIMTSHYNLIHRFRWAVLAICVVATIVCIYFAQTLTLPETTEVRLLPESHPLEFHFIWNNYLLATTLFSEGSAVKFVLGLNAGDTGRQNDPNQLSRFFPDNTFDASSTEAQQYLVDFCDTLYSNDFASKPNSEYVCAINQFDSWLSDQSISASPEAIYTDSCGGADSLPMVSGDFDGCLTAWSQDTNNMNVFNRNGKIQILTITTKASVRFDASQNQISEEWNAYEKFVKEQSDKAPAGVNQMYHVSPMWWWFDTNQQMFKTAVGAAGIAIAFSAVIVLISSRSLVLTLFSGGCILYVLAAATASLVGLGWTLGFLESVCFAILVGISCDFIIHFGHAYIHYKGAVSKHERTKYSVVHMGPSILAAALTTISAAFVMLFCSVVFFTKFAMILFMTIIHATIGSFVVYIVLNDLFGPSEPTKFIDGLVAKLRGKGGGLGEVKEDLALTEEGEKAKENAAL